MAMIVTDLRTDYAKSQILHGVSLQVPAGEITCLLGRNGVGKSTTLKSIIGLAPPRAGSIRYRDNELVGLAPHQIARLGIGYVPEERRIFPTLTVMENLMMGHRVRPGGRPPEWTIDGILEAFPGLQRRVSSKAAFLSGGELQMLAIGRSLVANPEVMLIDEPTEGLAPVIVEVVEDVIRQVASSGIAVLLVESKLAVAERLATRVYVMSKGAIVFEGSLSQLSGSIDIRKKYLEV